MVLMGTPAPIENPGDHCSMCWSSGYPFYPIATPKYLTVEISGIERKPAWDITRGKSWNGIFTLTQEVGFPCQWFLLIDLTGGISVSYIANRLHVFVQNEVGLLTFEGIAPDDCTLSCDSNELAYWKNGKAVVSFEGSR